ncbi:MAG: methyltransferase domain-containing protein [Candidatus Margulisiibacteriota bacterium]|jgi:tRNA (cmo5U34)-methyltransferase
MNPNPDTSLNIGDSITIKDTWHFKGTVSQNFDEHIKKSVPFYEEGHNLILKIASYFLKENSVCYDLGTSTGSLIAKLAQKFQLSQFYGIDLEKDMTDIAKKNTAPLNNVEIITNNLLNLNFEKSNLFVAYYTIQFIEPKQRINLIKNIYNALNKGGAFIWFEKTMFNNAIVQKINYDLLTDFKLNKGFTPEEITAKNKSLQGILQPFSTKENFKLLHASGFKVTDTIFKSNFFEGYLVVK